MRRLVLIPLVFITACGAPEPAAEPQRWHDQDVRIETDPNPPKLGMNELKVVVQKRKGEPGVKGLMVSIKSDGDWQQAYPDGDLGIYHGAVRIAAEHAVVHVRIKSGEEVSELEFRLR